MSPPPQKRPTRSPAWAVKLPATPKSNPGARTRQQSSSAKYSAKAVRRGAWACLEVLNTDTGLWLPASRPSLLRVQSLVEEHLEVRLVPQASLGGQSSCPRKVGCRQTDCDG